MSIPQHASPFHFSPRPNRAADIRWHEWSQAAFERARAEDKPILLAISAVWCHWCHVMDETSYSQPAIISAINERYVPVRVDTDRRPDVNARYNQGGWPTTAFLTPDGSLLAGATYLPPEQMQQALEQIAGFYQNNREQIHERSQHLRLRRQGPHSEQTGSLEEPIVERIVAEIENRFDEEYGGFGDAPKFPMVDVLDFLLREYRVRADQRCFEMLSRTLMGMAGGGMYDHVEGGFFRYSTTRDWSVPHFEKMTEDHAALIRILAQLDRVTRNEQFHNTLRSSLGYVRTVLRDPRTGLFAGSQDADEAYFALPLSERRAREAPYVDRTSYSNWTASMAGAFFFAAAALEDDRVGAEGAAALDFLHERMRDRDGFLYHFIEPGGEPSVRGLLTDQAAYLNALLDAHEQSGEPRFLDRARDLAQAIQRRFQAPDGGFSDHAAVEEPLGNLVHPEKPLADNASLADSFARLAVHDGHAPHRDLARRTLEVYAESYARMGIFAAPYGRALRRYFHPSVSVALVGTARETAALREAAALLPDPLLCVTTIEPARKELLAERGFDQRLQPAAYVCAAQTCSAPVQNAADLRTAYESVR